MNSKKKNIRRINEMLLTMDDVTVKAVFGVLTRLRKPRDERTQKQHRRSKLGCQRL